MDVAEFRRLWGVTSVALPPAKRLEVLWQMLSAASELDVPALQLALGADQDDAKEGVLLNLVEGECSMPKAIGILRELRGDTHVTESWEFFNDSLTSAAARSNKLYPVAQQNIVDGRLLVPELYLAELNKLLAGPEVVHADPREDALLGGIRWFPKDDVTCVLAVYNSPQGPYVDPFVVHGSGPRRTASLAPRKSLAEPFTFDGVGTFTVNLSQ